MKGRAWLIASLILLSGCNDRARVRPPSATLTLAATIPIGSIAPFSSRAGLGANLIELLYRPLIHLSSGDGRILPELAKVANWEVGETRFKILVSEEVVPDVEYTFEYLKTLPVPEFKEGLKNLEKLERTQRPGELVFHLRRFDRMFPFLLSQIPILSSDSKKTTGDFIIASQKEDEVVLHRKTHSPNLVNQIIIRQIPSSRRIVRETVAGNVDMSFLTDDKTGLTLQELPNLGFGELKSTFLYFALINRNRRDLANIPWKQLSSRLNREEMIRQLETTGLEPAAVPIHPEDPWFVDRKISDSSSSSSSGPGAEVDGSKRRLSLYYLELQPIVGRIALLLKRNVAEAGVELDVRQLSPEEFGKKILMEKDFDLVLLPYAIKNSLSSNYFVFHSAEGPGSVNLAGYHNLEVDKHLEDARYESNNEKAKAAFGSAVSAMIEDPPGIFLFWLKTPILYRKSCTGFKFNTNEFFSSLKDVRCEPSAVN